MAGVGRDAEAIGEIVRHPHAVREPNGQKVLVIQGGRCQLRPHVRALAVDLRPTLDDVHLATQGGLPEPIGSILELPVSTQARQQADAIARFAVKAGVDPEEHAEVIA